MIVVNNLKKAYGTTVVLDIEHLEIPKGVSIGLVGNNGAGKTTLFSLILDLIIGSSGEVLSKGVAVSKSDHWKSYTTAFIDESFLIGYLTSEEYFVFLGELRGMTATAVMEELKQYETFFNGEVLGQKKYIRDYSKGNQKKIGIVGAFLGSPELVLLDEPFANIDPSTQFRLKELVKEKMVSKAMTIIISSHDLKHTFEISDRILLMEKGVLKKDVAKEETSLTALEGYFL